MAVLMMMMRSGGGAGAMVKSNSSSLIHDMWWRRRSGCTMMMMREIMKMTGGARKCVSSSSTSKKKDDSVSVSASASAQSAGDGGENGAKSSSDADAATDATANAATTTTMTTAATRTASSSSSSSSSSSPTASSSRVKKRKSPTHPPSSPSASASASASSVPEVERVYMDKLRNLRGSASEELSDRTTPPSSRTSSRGTARGMLLGALRSFSDSMFSRLIRATCDESFETEEFLSGARHAIETVVELQERYDPAMTTTASRGAGEQEETKEEKEVEEDHSDLVGDEAFAELISPLGVTAMREMYADYDAEDLRRVFRYEYIDDMSVHESGSVNSLSLAPFNRASSGAWRTRPMHSEDASVSSYHSMMADEAIGLLDIVPLHGNISDFAGAWLAISVRVEGLARISFLNKKTKKTLYEGLDDTPRVWTFIRGPLPSTLPAPSLGDMDWKLLFAPLHSSPTLRFYGVKFGSR